MARDVAEFDHLMNVDEFLRVEERSDFRHELVGGVMYAQAGALRRHNEAARNLLRWLATVADDGPCRVYGSDMLVRVNENTAYYPDLTITCDPRDVHQRYNQHPCVVIELLSSSTVVVDRTEKLFAYQGIAGLLAYLMVETDDERVIRCWREDESAPWQVAFHRDGTVPIPCLEFELPVENIFRGLTPLAAETDDR